MWSILINAFGYLASAAGLWRIRHRETPPPREERRPLVTEIREGLAFVVRHPLLRRLIACTGLSNLFNSISNVLFIFYLVKVLHLSALTIGIIEAVGAVGGLVGALVCTRLSKWIGEGPTIIATATIFCAASFFTVGAFYFPAVPMLMIGLAIGGASVVAYNIATVSFRQRLCPPKLLGRMNASARFLVWGTMPIGGFIGGVLGHQLGTIPTLWIAAAGGLLSLLPVYISPLWTLKALPSHDADDSTDRDQRTALDVVNDVNNVDGVVITEKPAD